jgi:hypothetical protein
MKKIIILILMIISVCVSAQSQNNISNKGINVSVNTVTSPGLDRPVFTGVTYSIQAQAYFDRMPVLPASDTLAMFAEFIDSLVSNGKWNKIDVLCVLANRDTVSAFLNMKGNTFNAVSYSTRVFTPYKGWNGNHTSAHLNTNFNPSTASGYYTLNSGTMSVYNNSNLTSGYTMGVSDGTQKSIIVIQSSTYYAINAGAGLFINTTSTTIGLTTVTRVASGDYRLYYNGTDVSGIKTHASVGLPNGNIYVGCYNNIPNGGVDQAQGNQYALYMIGGGLTAQDVADFNSCVQRLKTKIGW